MIARIVTEFLGYLRVERGSSRHTVAAYTRDLKRYTDYLNVAGITDLSDVTSTHIGAFMQAIRTGSDGGRALAASSAARVLSAVRSLHKFALGEGVVENDVSKAVSPPTQSKVLPSVLSIAEVQAMLESASGDDPISLRDRALLEVLYGTGARVSEATGLSIDDVGEDSLRLFGKGSKVRIVPMGSYARSAIDAYLVRSRPVLATKGKGTPRLFLNTRGAPLSRQSGFEIVRTHAERAGITQTVSPHTLRHSFATHLLSGGADVRVVQELLGHASVTTTQIYTHITIDALRESYVTSHPRAFEDPANRV